MAWQFNNGAESGVAYWENPATGEINFDPGFTPPQEAAPAQAPAVGPLGPLWPANARLEGSGDNSFVVIPGDGINGETAFPVHGEYPYQTDNARAQLNRSWTDSLPIMAWLGGAGGAAMAAAGAGGAAGAGASATEAAGAMGGAAGTAGGGLTAAEAAGVTGAAGAGGTAAGTAALDAGMDLGTFNTVANPYAGGALEAGTATAVNQAAATGAGVGGAGAGAAATGAAAGTALSRLLDGTASTADYLNVAGTAGATGLGIYGANQQANAYEGLARDYMALGAPSRARYEESFDPNFNLTSMPGFQQTMDTSWETALRKLSATGGNPYGNPGGLTEAQKYVVGSVGLPQLNEYRRLNAGAGGLAALTSAAPGAATGAIGAQGGVYDALGYGLGQVTNPPTNLETLLRQMRGTGGLS